MEAEAVAASTVTVRFIYNWGSVVRLAKRGLNYAL